MPARSGGGQRKPPTPKVTPKPPTPTIQEERRLQKRKKAKPVEEPYELLPERLAFGLQGRPTTGGLTYGNAGYTLYGLSLIHISEPTRPY